MLSHNKGKTCLENMSWNNDPAFVRKTIGLHLPLLYMNVYLPTLYMYVYSLAYLDYYSSNNFINLSAHTSRK